MTYNEVIKISDTYLLPVITERYNLDGYTFTLIGSHDRGRNVVYTCEKEGAAAIIIRIAFLKDRSREAFLGEVEYIRYLFEHGGSVSNVISSRQGKLLEEITYEGHSLFVCAFEKARGKSLAENYYQYREGVPITEYYYNCGKVLGNMHQLSKGYTPSHNRYHFLEKYNAEYIDQLIPDSFSRLKKKLQELLTAAEDLDKDREAYGMVHFDYNDGNYMIDFATGQITVYDFDNSCYCWYMFDLAGVWMNGFGWIQFELDLEKRKKFMEDYFASVLAGYRSETEINAAMLEKLPFFINLNILESIVDTFEVARNNEEEFEYDEELAYLVKCLEDDIPYKGFFHEIYSCEDPFTYEVEAK